MGSSLKQSIILELRWEIEQLDSIIRTQQVFVDSSSWVDSDNCSSQIICDEKFLLVILSEAVLPPLSVGDWVVNYTVNALF